MKLPPKTRCPQCGYKDATVACRFCGISKVLPKPVPAPDTHDFRDRGDPMEKIHPDPNHWSRWNERPDTFPGR